LIDQPEADEFEDNHFGVIRETGVALAWAPKIIGVEPVLWAKNAIANSVDETRAVNGFEGRVNQLANSSRPLTGGFSRTAMSPPRTSKKRRGIFSIARSRFAYGRHVVATVCWVAVAYR